MDIKRRLGQFAVAGAMAIAVAGTAVAGDKTTNTILGAGIGAAAGAVLSQGDPMYTLGGAAAGGVLGHVLTDDDDRRRGKYKRRDWDDGRRYVSHPRYYGPPGKAKGHYKHKHKHKKHRRHR